MQKEIAELNRKINHKTLKEKVVPFLPDNPKKSLAFINSDPAITNKFNIYAEKEKKKGKGKLIGDIHTNFINDDQERPQLFRDYQEQIRKGDNAKVFSRSRSVNSPAFKAKSQFLPEEIVMTSSVNKDDLMVKDITSDEESRPYNNNTANNDKVSGVSGPKLQSIDMSEGQKGNNGQAQSSIQNNTIKIDGDINKVGSDSLNGSNADQLDSCTNVSALTPAAQGVNQSTVAFSTVVETKDAAGMNGGDDADNDTSESIFDDNSTVVDLIQVSELLTTAQESDNITVEQTSGVGNETIIEAGTSRNGKSEEVSHAEGKKQINQEPSWTKITKVNVIPPIKLSKDNQSINSINQIKK